MALGGFRSCVLGACSVLGDVSSCVLGAGRGGGGETTLLHLRLLNFAIGKRALADGACIPGL